MMEAQKRKGVKHAFFVLVEMMLLPSEMWQLDATKLLPVSRPEWAAKIWHGQHAFVHVHSLPPPLFFFIGIDQNSLTLSISSRTFCVSLGVFKGLTGCLAASLSLLCWPANTLSTSSSQSWRAESFCAWPGQVRLCSLGPLESLAWYRPEDQDQKTNKITYLDGVKYQLNYDR